MLTLEHRFRVERFLGGDEKALKVETEQLAEFGSLADARAFVASLPADDRSGIFIRCPRQDAVAELEFI